MCGVGVSVCGVCECEFVCVCVCLSVIYPTMKVVTECARIPRNMSEDYQFSCIMAE